MKTKTLKNTCLILGILCGLLNLIMLGGFLIEYTLSPFARGSKIVYMIPYLLPAPLFLMAAYRLHKKIKHTNSDAVANSIN
ncbi:MULTISPECIES: hypothetical protein [Niastella]|uniref:Uncharacterized protein n=1 Tax=Niastella soli TaxID=2821487 RepID=A0ABS3Z1I7_9BACT|nr:hypothetical protein [Niastella soli]MBO9203261.1 hypothetical protein [Niastella soli]